ncbi:MAG: transposase [bacterium]
MDGLLVDFKIRGEVFDGHYFIIPYHVTQRGNRREDIFFGDEDRKRYLEWLKVYSERHGLKIWAYCLMTNHIHLVVVPCHKDSLEKTMRSLHTR